MSVQPLRRVSKPGMYSKRALEAGRLCRYTGPMATEYSREAYRATLAGKTVGIAGCGGLGSNCAVALARAGVGSLVVADFDVVSEANLDRQYFFHDQIGLPKVDALAVNILRIDPCVRVRGHSLRLGPNEILRLFANVDVLVEAFDQADQKLMLLETVLRYLPELPLVTASGLAGWGDSQALRVRRSGKLVIIGDEKREVCVAWPPMAPRVGVVACLQANEVLERLLGPMPETADSDEAET
ncbi:MAG TPA: hypothetical protein DD477_08050 [Spirochaetaceae bacterium]|nr:hypothetical protein [Spirochaetaceae bacterium]HBO41153.1 hypothetical protein [Spirochaetaceae bacterium]HCQ86003.1 hypothetical protein [Spirochaetaceae bacterium]